ncbi:glutamate racemase [Clostridium pasteurianum DSM 525 = ATCC 6013]|uniref:Glutamate racemase n=1 Tax=Clostridium pasteurianum DSM 525 = ATCC 6013 TaxID=1262449 RepID=A0A0H3J981_CLOPA|nr:glutamate racemase [Clostridium pasteurianum]AJA49837.1 glutamate racemase [Clostridium pasteurianum DSM 525 = ATCC 6013]AJA53825.1 glutamate racemase [Clostridium pasteurianum DSM 525 = ATCC 6013]AOZ76981.1 glutamate racemase [Clostridium pasteurianum DSM 525 = ATCC 6013]AOZ80778.1 glutamate racemase [Clostridium pasteurianum]ELP57796.1 glutamate racemase [Clostridium pasteurianum DSM 525 = ATCC 6013]
MDVRNRPIGFFDSGVGGISVLKEAIRILPKEDFIYYGDSKNAPYGDKSVDEIRQLSFNVAQFLVEKNIKALVVACNTATSAAIKDLRKKYSNIPVIGIEPALKPAVEIKGMGKILIMATPVTLSEKKFNNLLKKYNGKSDIIPVPCPGLAELIEAGILSGNKLQNYLEDKLSSYIQNEIAAIVLGCTHYPFIKDEISKLIPNVPIIDGSIGTVKQLKRKLITLNLLNVSGEKGKVQMINSSESKEIMELSNKLLKLSYN